MAGMFDDALREIRDVQYRVESLDGQHDVELGDLLPDEFVILHTDFPSIADVINASGFMVETGEDFEAIPDSDWDYHIKRFTRFDSWSEMLQVAGEEWASRQLDIE